MESNRKYNAISSTLKRHDVSALAERRRRNVVTTPAFDGCRCCYDPNSDGHGEYRALIDYKMAHPIQEQQHNARATLDETENQEPNIHSDRDDDSDSDDEFDYLLDEDLPGDDNAGGLKALEEQRRAELEFEMLKRHVALLHGYGTHRQLHPGRALKAAGLAQNPARPPPPAVVLHLVDPDSVTSASLDYYLETELAPKFSGTVFMRSGGRTCLLMNQGLAQKAFGNQLLQADRDIPALVAIRDGIAVNIAPQLKGLCSEDGGPIEPSAVEMWLEQSGVLLSQPPMFDNLCYIRPEEDALMDYLATQKPPEVAEEERYDCGMEGCNKTFRHEHVGIKTSEQDGLVVKAETILGEEDKQEE